MLGDGLSDDPAEALAELNRRHEVHLAARKRTEYTPVLVARAWEWMLKEFGDGSDLEALTIDQLVELYLDS